MTRSFVYNGVPFGSKIANHLGPNAPRFKSMCSPDSKRWLHNLYYTSPWIYSKASCPVTKILWFCLLCAAANSRRFLIWLIQWSIELPFWEFSNFIHFSRQFIAAALPIPTRSSWEERCHCFLLLQFVNHFIPCNKVPTLIPPGFGVFKDWRQYRTNEEEIVCDLMTFIAA